MGDEHDEWSCIFHLKDDEFSEESSLMVVVGGCGQVGRGPRGGKREALSTASGQAPCNAHKQLDFKDSC